MIKNYKLEDFTNKTYLKKSDKKLDYGEVITPYSFIELIISSIPIELFKDKTLKWLDPGAGQGNFSIIVYYKLLEGLKDIIPNIEERSNHIITKMLFMVEIQEDNCNILEEIFGENANIYCKDYLNFEADKFDIIIGNPPFNSKGQIKVPTKKGDKKNDGKTIWPDFVIKSLSLLKENGKLCFFIPSIWLKPDKRGLYYILFKHKIEYINCFSNTITNSIFKGQAQTPSCFFVLTKQPRLSYITIYDTDVKKYVFYDLVIGKPIPLFGQLICNKLKNYPYIEVIKTNLPSKTTKFSLEATEEYKYKNISTCRLNKLTPELVINYSCNPQCYYNTPKLVLAHKMYGFPYLDKSGEYGISNRDNYVIIKNDVNDLVKLQKFLSTKTALYLFESTRYRMKYLEKYAFELIPDITKLDDFPESITDETIGDYFNFTEVEREYIDRLHNHKYNFFIMTN